MTVHRIAWPLRALLVIGIAVAILGVSPDGQAPGVGSLERKVDALFAHWNAQTPGCAVGVSLGGRIVLEKAYGMADLEHDVPNKPESVFGINSISKQFTAAAVLLLARDGKLSLDDPVRRYIPELPDYGKPLLIRHLLTHTSGLREWATLERIAGWPHHHRQYTFAAILDIIGRQRALNFEPGSNFCYTNANYNLAAVIVARVSGQSLAQFCDTRIFQPLGMTKTWWLEDYETVLKGRAIGYSPTAEGYRRNMPEGGVYGHGGLQMTVGDLLRWNENFFAPTVGDQEFLHILQEPGRLNSGRQHYYALGLTVRDDNGLRQVLHSGSGNGYRSWAGRFPDKHLSVVVLCNTSDVRPGPLAHAVADLYLAGAIKTSSVPADHPLPVTDRMKSRAGTYRSMVTGAVLTIAFENGQFRLEGGATPAPLVPTTDSRLDSRIGAAFEFDPGGGLRVVDVAHGALPVRYERVDPAHPTAAELKALSGTYRSDEAEVTVRVAVENGELVLRRPDARFALHPLCRDAFSASGLSAEDVARPFPPAVLLFRRDAHGSVTSFSVVATGPEESVWDLRFDRRDVRS